MKYPKYHSPEDVSQMGVAPAFSICWQCHYVGQIAVGEVSRPTPRTPGEGNAALGQGSGE